MSDPVLNAATPSQIKLELLRLHFPQAVETDADGRIRINAAALQMAIDPGNLAGIQVEEDGYELRCVGKREAYQSAFVPVQKILTQLPAENKHWDSTGNLLIKGDNLDALRLLRHSYFGKIKLIYIDPPYNTQSDAFIYRDDFTARQSEVLAQLGYAKDDIEYIKNIYGARTHSGWLSFMYPRLLLAKDLLQDDGVMFISIDDNEQAQLKLLCDEVFGQENFVTSITTQVNKGGRDYLPIAVTHETLLCYVKDAENESDSIFELSKKDKKFDFEDSRGGFDARELRNRNPKFTKANRPNLAYEVFIDPKSADKNKFCKVSLTPCEKFSVSVTPLNSKQQSSVWRWGPAKFAENNTD
ncbi:MAG: site-specific DNA-methyltransferase, partial [Rhodoferax sp.]